MYRRRQQWEDHCPMMLNHRLDVYILDLFQVGTSEKNVQKQ